MNSNIAHDTNVFKTFAGLLSVCLQAEIRETELKRLQDERAELRERLCESRARNREMTFVMNDLQLCLDDLQSEVRLRSLADVEDIAFSLYLL